MVANKEKLATILANEREKEKLQNKVPMQRQSGTDARYRPLSLSTRDASRGIAGHAGSTQGTLASTSKSEGAAGQTSTQRYVEEDPMLSTVNRGPIAKEVNIRAQSEWAVLTKYQASQARADAELRKSQVNARKDNQRSILDMQKAEHEAQKHFALEEKVRDKLRIEQDVRAYEAEERRKIEVRLQRELKVREEREWQRTQIEAKKMDMLATKRADEAKLLADMKKREEDEKAEALRRKEEQKMKYAETLRENAQKIEMKKHMAEKEIEDDRKLQKEYDELLATQERRRAETLAALYSKSQRRAAVAGEQVVKEAEFKEKQTELRLAATLKAKEEADNAKAAAAAAKRAKATQEQLDWLARQVEDREEQKRARVREMRAYTETLLIKNQLAEAEAQSKILARKQKDLEFQAYLEQQMRDKEAKRPVNWVMNQRERQINSHLLVDATPVVHHILP